jgi:phage tail sheath gpL-like
MSLTNIANQKTPGRPVEITFSAELGTPSDSQELLLIGHAASGAGSGSAAAYQVSIMANVADVAAASAEALGKFGSGSELLKMVVAAVAANEGGSAFPNIKCVPLASTDTDFGSSDAALTAAKRVKAEYLVSCYDGMDATLTGKLKAAALAMSGAQNVENNQFGSIGVVFNRSVSDPTLLTKYDTQFLMAVWLRDSGSPSYSIGEMAAASAARAAANLSPFNPLDSITIQNMASPDSMADWPTVGSGLESEAALNQGWTPLYVKPNSEVAFVRTVTTRISPDGSGTPVVSAYYDLQDFNVLYFWRKTIFTRFSQADFKQRKASAETAKDIKAEMIRLATLFESQNMFQAVSQLAKQFKVERSSSDRHRFDVLTPVNVIPGLHVIATNVSASTQFDVLSI